MFFNFCYRDLGTILHVYVSIAYARDISSRSDEMRVVLTAESDLDVYCRRRPGYVLAVSQFHQTTVVHPSIYSHSCSPAAAAAAAGRYFRIRSDMFVKEGSQLSYYAPPWYRTSLQAYVRPFVRPSVCLFVTCP